ncbi:MAG: hypothetical protein HYW90_02660 [Candidatus Sungbacteria bacterium]|nr:hypothetical protein [Candidatus Sungbacteria bacterium]
MNEWWQLAIIAIIDGLMLAYLIKVFWWEPRKMENALGDFFGSRARAMQEAYERGDTAECEHIRQSVHNVCGTVIDRR